jgi:GNAT superfamily N-acetyltransferase
VPSQHAGPGPNTDPIDGDVRLLVATEYRKSGSCTSACPCKDSGVTAVIRPTGPEEASVLREIERLAGERFREVGLPEVADDEPASVETLARHAKDGRSWVAVDHLDRPIGYVLVDVVDGCAHVEQVSVLPNHQGAGVGRELLRRVRAWAADSGLSAITLTTFKDVPWNAPLYRHLGFRTLRDDELGPQLRAVRDKETAHGLDAAKRVCMRSELTD